MGRPKPCLDCGARTRGGSRCDRHQPIEDARRAAQVEALHRGHWYRVYQTEVYRTARRIRMVKAGGQCERVIGDVRCSAPAVEAHHVHPLSSCRDLAEALAFSRWEYLEAVCAQHHPGAHGNP